MKKNYFNIIPISCLILCTVSLLSACSGYNTYSQPHVDSTIKTPNQTIVHTAKYDELSTEDFNDLVSYIEENFPNVSKPAADGTRNQKYLRDPSYKYNCYSYAFYSQSASNEHWIGHQCSSDDGLDTMLSTENFLDSRSILQKTEPK